MMIQLEDVHWHDADITHFNVTYLHSGEFSLTLEVAEYESNGRPNIELTIDRLFFFRFLGVGFVDGSATVRNVTNQVAPKFDLEVKESPILSQIELRDIRIVLSTGSEFNGVFADDLKLRRL